MRSIAVLLLVLVCATGAAARPGPGAGAGRWITFQKNGWIWLVHENGSGLHRFVRGWNPSWSRDGRTMLFGSTRGFELISADGEERRVVPNTRAVGWNPVLSPDASEIAYTGEPANPADLYTVVWTMGVDGEHKRQASPSFHGTAGGDDEASFLPGGRLLVTRTRRAPLPEHSRSIGVLTPSIRHLDRLVYGDSPSTTKRGGLIAFRASIDGNSQLYLADRLGRHVRRITRAHGNRDPALSPDGHRIAFVRKDKGLFVMDVNGRHLRWLVRGGVSFPAWRPVSPRGR